jgi:serine/threonine protein kinase/tetratricopeptide (TPR) repeat protein
MAEWDQVKQLFDDLVDLPPEQRSALLRERCAGNSALFAEVERLFDADDQARSLMETVAIFPPVSNHGQPNVFSSGQTASGRFRILRFLGRGGMGEVYEAEDLKLGGLVALKTIRPEIASDQKVFDRFLREIRLAKEVTHPNVCRVFDLDHHSQPPFLTMELLSGETLSARLRREKFTTAEALPLVEQMALALAAAHEQGIIHRDFKPGNVMLTPGKAGVTRAVVTDFGLARTVDGDSTMTPAGTPNYMAPEQLTDGRATAESDIYSFGLVMHEMVTGARPDFHRLREPAPSPRRYAPDLDSSWEAAILRCLERDPAQRFSSAADVVRAIRGEPLSPRQSPSRRALLETCTVLAFLSLSGDAVRAYMGKATVREGSSVLLTDVQNSTQDPELDGVTEVLRSQLLQSTRFDLVDRDRVAEILKLMVRDPVQKLDPPAAREVALRDGAPLVVFGTLSRLAQEYTLSLQIEKVWNRPDAAAASWHQTWNAPNKKDLFGVIRQGSIWIRKMAGEATHELLRQDQPPEDTTTNSWRALQLLTQANAKTAAGEDEAALLLLREAVWLDPDFAMANMRMADILISLKRFGEGYEYWQKAIRLTGKRRLTSREDLRIKGQYYEDTGDISTAEGVYRVFAERYPNDFLPWFLLGSALSDLGRDEEAIQKFSEAAKRRPLSYTAPAHLAMLYLDLGQFPKAEAEANKIGRLGQREWALWLGASSTFIQGNFENGLKQVSFLSDSPDDSWRSRSYALRACWMSELGRYRDAATLLDEGMEFDATRGLRTAQADKCLMLGYLAYRQGSSQNCKELCGRVLSLDNNPGRSAQVGALLAKSGHIREAQSLLAAMRSQPDLPRIRRDRYRLAGEIALAQGNAAEAVHLLRASAQLDLPRATREYLARALEFAGDRAGAMEIYQQIVLRQGRLWPEPDREFPGLWTDALLRCARLAHSLGREDAAAFARRYLQMMRNADGGLPDVREAKTLLH